MTNRNRTLLVTRHQATVLWLAEQHIAVDSLIPHLDIEDIRKGDTVIGTLPIQLACAVCHKGATYRHLTLDMPAELRGQELGVEQLKRCNPRLERYEVIRVED